MVDVRVSVLNPSATSYLQRDVYAADFNGGYIKYDQATGSGELSLGLRFEEMFARGYYSQFNIIEISTGDDNLAQGVTANLLTGSKALTGWSVGAGAGTIAANGPGGAADFELAGTSSASAESFAQSGVFSLTGGVTYTFSAWVDDTWVSAGGVPLVDIFDPTISTLYATGGVLTVGRISCTYTPPTTRNVRFVLDANRATVASGHSLRMSLPMLEARASASPFWVPDASSYTTAEVAAGAAARLYVTSTLPYDPAQGEDTQQVYLTDTNLSSSGIGLTMGLPVITVATEPASGQAYLTVAAPLTMPSNPASIGAYATNSILGRRRHSAIVRRVQRPNQRYPQATVTLGALSDSFNEVQFGYTVGAAASVDVTAAISGFLSQNATRWPHLTYAAANFASNTGSPFIGQRQTCTVAQGLSDAMLGISNGDLWITRVGHDRKPRMIKLYTNGTNTYAYNVTLTQGTTAFEPTGLIYVDQDCTQYENAVQVMGTTNPATNQPFSAIVVDSTAVATIGRQIDGQPVTNTSLPSVTACSTYGLGLLNQRSLGQQRGTCRVDLRQDQTYDTLPQGLRRGDVVRGVQCVTIAGMQGGAPSVFGLVASVVTTIDSATGAHYQDISFAPVTPDWGAYVRQLANQAATSLHANTGAGAAPGQYALSPSAIPPTWSAASLVLSIPAFTAMFAPPNLLSVAASTITLPANATTWIWLTSGGTWDTQANGSTRAGEILYGFAQTNASGIIGFTPLCASTQLTYPVSSPFNGQGSMVPTSVPSIVLSSSDISGGAGTAFRITNNPSSPGTAVSYSFGLADGSTVTATLMVNDTSGITAPGTYYYSFKYNTVTQSLTKAFGPSTTAATQAQIDTLFLDSNIPVSGNCTVTCTAGGTSTGGSTGGVGGHSGGSGRIAF